MQDYRVQLDSYSGPMELLLYLIRRDEVDVYDIPISRILEQYLDYVRMLEQLDPDIAGDFLVLAATLMEIKSRLLLPKPPPESETDDLFDPRADLVRQLLAYRTFREAALRLQDQADVHARRYPRAPTEPPSPDGDVDIEDVQIWDLLGAFNKLLAAVGRERATHDVRYDDTPITLHAADILDRLEREGPVMSFERIFEGRTRGEMVGLFLALLELIRQQRIRIQQDNAFATIHVHLIDSTPITTILDAQADADAESPAAEAVENEADEAEAIDEEYEEETTSGPGEALFEDEGMDDDEDEFSRQIRAVEIADVDLGRSPRHEMADDAPGETAIPPDEENDLPS